jgi:hypothetical protein
MAKTRSGFWGGHQTPGGRKGERTKQGSALNSNSMTATSTFSVTESMKKARFEE